MSAYPRAYEVAIFPSYLCFTKVDFPQTFAIVLRETIRFFYRSLERSQTEKSLNMYDRRSRQRGIVGNIGGINVKLAIKLIKATVQDLISFTLKKMPHIRNIFIYSEMGHLIRNPGRGLISISGFI